MPGAGVHDIGMPDIECSTLDSGMPDIGMAGVGMHNIGMAGVGMIGLTLECLTLEWLALGVGWAGGDRYLLHDVGDHSSPLFSMKWRTRLYIGYSFRVPGIGQMKRGGSS